MLKGTNWYPVYKVSEGAGQPITWSGNEVTDDITSCHIDPATKCDTQYKSPLILKWDKLQIKKVLPKGIATCDLPELFCVCM